MDLRALSRRFSRPGRLEHIVLRPAHRVGATAVESVVAIAGIGLDGDRAASVGRGGRRHVTLIQSEHLPVIAAMTGWVEVAPSVPPAIRRRERIVTATRGAQPQGRP